MQNAIEFFKTTHFCSTASVTDVSLVDENITVSLEIDPRWAKTLSKKTADLRTRWFGIHCPIEYSKVWNDIPLESDIIIQSNLPVYGLYRFNCRNPL